MKKTFADVAGELARKEGKYEKLLSEGNTFEKNTAERMLGRINQFKTHLAMAQEAIKAQTNHGSNDAIPHMGDGGITEFISAFQKRNKNAMYENIGSNILDGALQLLAVKSMNAPTEPNYLPYSHMNDTVDISPAINNANRNMVLAQRSADNNLKDVQVAEAYKDKAFLDNTNAISNLVSEANRQKQQIDAQNLYSDRQTNAQNIAYANRYNDELTSFNNNRNAAYANILSRTLQNYRAGKRDIDANNSDLLKFIIMAKTFGNTGVVDRLLSDPTIQKLIG